MGRQVKGRKGVQYIIPMVPLHLVILYACGNIVVGDTAVKVGMMLYQGNITK